mmetsp:Transcript_123527/g.395127  ORF Transcript_123527/g.395127 Transcript_123527/m.395127 type:complete len:646 (-) Transcript_123527:5626-7563(-)
MHQGGEHAALRLRDFEEALLGHAAEDAVVKHAGQMKDANDLLQVAQAAGEDGLHAVGLGDLHDTASREHPGERRRARAPQQHELRRREALLAHHPLDDRAAEAPGRTCQDIDSILAGRSLLRQTLHLHTRRREGLDAGAENLALERSTLHPQVCLLRISADQCRDVAGVLRDICKAIGRHVHTLNAQLGRLHGNGLARAGDHRAGGGGGADRDDVRREPGLREVLHEARELPALPDLDLRGFGSASKHPRGRSADCEDGRLTLHRRARGVQLLEPEFVAEVDHRVRGLRGRRLCRHRRHPTNRVERRTLLGRRRSTSASPSQHRRCGAWGREPLGREQRELGRAPLHQSSDGIAPPGGVDHGSHLLHELVAAREVVDANLRSNEPLPTRCVSPGCHVVAGAAIHLETDTVRHALACELRRAEPPLGPHVNAQIRAQKRHDVLEKLVGLRDLGGREGVLRDLLVRHRDVPDGRRVHGGRLAPGDVERQRRGGLTRREAEGQLDGEAAAHREADEHVLRASEVRQDGVAEGAEQDLVLLIVLRDPLLRATATSGQLDGDDFDNVICLLRPGGEEGGRAAGEGQAVGLDRRFRAARLAEAEQSLWCNATHGEDAIHGGGCRSLSLGVGRRRGVFRDLHVDRALRVGPQ